MIKSWTWSSHVVNLFKTLYFYTVVDGGLVNTDNISIALVELYSSGGCIQLFLTNDNSEKSNSQKRKLQI